MFTKAELIPMIVPGAQVLVRDEDWIVRSISDTKSDGRMVKVVGRSELVADLEATFFTSLDSIEPVRPEDTELVADDSGSYRRSRLWMEAVLRKAPIPVSQSALAVGHEQLLADLRYQRLPAHLALKALRPRLLIADAVGLGKTLEIGIALSELIRRGRGERILVVVPRQILEQFQHEMWTRFSIGLVRLDSEGIQKVRQKIPPTRNPFTYFKRVIVSIDTLKQAGRYRHQLENVNWNVVVIDEVHNLINSSSQRNSLARVLAPRADALILASATPHNGKKESFAELVRLLDPAAITDPKNYTRQQVQHLYLQRFKKDVQGEVGKMFADRHEPKAITVGASPAEEAVLADIADHWIIRSTKANKDTLFPWTLLKAALSSAPALLSTVDQRLQTLTSAASTVTTMATAAKSTLPELPLTGDPVATMPSNATESTKIEKAVEAGLTTDLEQSGVFTPVTLDENRDAELQALERLRRLASSATPDDSAKLRELINQLHKIGVNASSSTRVVIFSERVQTVTWLATELSERLGMSRGAVQVLHAGLPEANQLEVIEDFGQADRAVRVLVTTDIASEGVNLHRQCHHLIHFDMPWSLIRVQQRNGRIDRYGQMHRPEIRALLLTSDQKAVSDENRVAERLLQREDEALRTLGDVAPILGRYSIKEEEERIGAGLARGETPEEIVPDNPVSTIDWLGFFPEDDTEPQLNQTSNETAAPAKATSRSVEVPVITTPRLIASDWEFVKEALSEVLGDDRRKLNLTIEEDRKFIALTPPADLLGRLSMLPTEAQQAMRERTPRGEQEAIKVKLTADREFAEDRLTEARERDRSQSMWPDVGWLGAHHPIFDWLVDKLLVGFGRNQAPVLLAKVSAPTYLVQVSFTNRRGQPTIVEWYSVEAPGSRNQRIRPMFDVLTEANVGPKMANPGTPSEAMLRSLQREVPTVVRAAKAQAKIVRDERRADLDVRVADEAKRVNQWRHEAFAFAETKSSKDRVERTHQSLADYTETLKTEGDPFVRMVAVLAPINTGQNTSPNIGAHNNKSEGAR
jgi:ERCC4-related helicase